MLDRNEVTVSQLIFHTSCCEHKNKNRMFSSLPIISDNECSRIGDFGNETRLLLEQLNHRTSQHNALSNRTNPLRTNSITTWFQVQWSTVSSYHSYRSPRNISVFRRAEDVCLRLLLSGSDELGIAPARHLQWMLSYGGFWSQHFAWHVLLIGSRWMASCTQIYD